MKGVNMNISPISSYSNLSYSQKSFKGGFNKKAYNYVKPLVAGDGLKFTTLCALSAIGITVFDKKIDSMRKDFSKNYTDKEIMRHSNLKTVWLRACQLTC